MEAHGNCIISEDLNAHHALWGSELSNPRGNSVAEVVMDLNLKVMNTGEPTRIHPLPGRISVPDISLATNDIGLLTNWESMTDARGSDHYPVKLSTARNSAHRSEAKQGIGIKRVDWGIFREKMRLRVNNQGNISQDNYTEVYRRLVEDIQESLRESGARMPNEKGAIISPRIPVPAPWWDQDCRVAIDNRRAAYTIYRKDSSDANWDEFVKAEKDVAKMIQEKKNQGFQKFCSSLNPSANMGQIRKNLKVFKKKATLGVPQSRPSNTVKEDPALVRAFDKTASNHQTTGREEDWVYPHIQNETLTGVITIAEVNHAVESARSKSAPGCDLISYM